MCAVTCAASADVSSLPADTSPLPKSQCLPLTPLPTTADEVSTAESAAASSSINLLSSSALHSHDTDTFQAHYMMASLTVHDYQVGWICALPEELTAAMAMLDEKHNPLVYQEPNDRNSYVFGRIQQHNVVIAGMSAGVDGLVSAANVARDMARTFPTLRIGLMVGIGGGIPNLAKGVDIRLGDIVVSTRVIQYDKGKAEQGGQFVVKGQLNQPPSLLLNAVTRIRAQHAMDPSEVATYIDKAIKKKPLLEENGFGFPSEPDRFCCSLCNCTKDTPFTECTGLYTERRSRKAIPLIHYGVIASGNQVIKDTVVRNRLRDDFDALCVEMEAAGLMNDFPCLVVRGICDYADVHKNDGWHAYSAMTAAAYAKELLQYITPAQICQQQPIQEVIGVLDDISRTTKAQLEATQTHVQQSKSQYESEKHNQCHQVFKIGPYEEQKNINIKRVDGTCQWVLSHTQYTQWNSSVRDDLLWISADPGCGKSVLARSLVDHELHSTPNHIVCYFFFKDNEEQDHLATALCALLHQLFSQQPQLVTHAMPAWEKACNQLTKDVSELWRILLAAAGNSEAPTITCVIDAIDECRPTHQRHLVEMLARFYNNVSAVSTESQQKQLKFLITSRPYDNIESEFQKYLDDLPTIRLRGEDENDQIHQEIDLVIRLRVENLATDLDLDERVKELLLDKLLRMEHRTYLWLYLATDSIAETYRNSLRPAEAVIESLPMTVEAAYENILARVSQNQKGIVKKILQFVVEARRPLTIQEMAIALGVATTTRSQSLDQMSLDPKWLKRHLRHWCGLFVFINHDRIHLIHQTAKEFLINNGATTTPLSGWKHSLNPSESAKELARVCIIVICSKEAEYIAHQLRTGHGCFNNHFKSFTVYSAVNWPKHLEKADLYLVDILMIDVARLYDTRSSLHDVWFPFLWKDEYAFRKQPRMNPIRLAALLGHEKILRMILHSHNDNNDDCDQIADDNDNDNDVNSHDQYGDTALILAFENRDMRMVKILAKNGADIDARGSSSHTVLQLASSRGAEKTILALLDMGADVNAKAGPDGHALYIASRQGHERIVQALLDAGAEIDTPGGRMRGTSLQLTSSLGHERIVDILSDRGANVNAIPYDTSTALQRASAHGHENIVQTLLKAGACVDAEGGLEGNALQRASAGGHERVVHILLGAGANVDAPGQHGNALYKASANGHEKIVQALLKFGANVNAVSEFRHKTALIAASAKDHEGVVQMLLKAGAMFDPRDRYGDNALDVALARGHKDVVQVLLRWGAEVNDQVEILRKWRLCEE